MKGERPFSDYTSITGMLTMKRLHDFFADALSSFSEDNDVDKALNTLGLASLNDRLPNFNVTLMPHQVRLFSVDLVSGS